MSYFGLIWFEFCSHFCHHRPITCFFLKAINFKHCTQHKPYQRRRMGHKSPPQLWSGALGEVEFAHPCHLHSKQEVCCCATLPEWGSSCVKPPVWKNSTRREEKLWALSERPFPEVTLSRRLGWTVSPESALKIKEITSTGYRRTPVITLFVQAFAMAIHLHALCLLRRGHVWWRVLHT